MGLSVFQECPPNYQGKPGGIGETANTAEEPQTQRTPASSLLAQNRTTA